MQYYDNEAEMKRLEALHSYRVLDTGFEQELHDIVELASAICGTPIAQISLVDSRRQWVKASFGLDPRETPREFSFCDHAIQQPGDIFEVQDSYDDVRFSSNPMVTGEPRIRYYAGSPLITPSGRVLGTLCVIDRKPNKLSDAARRALHILSARTMQFLEMKRINIFLSEQVHHSGRKVTQLYENLLRAKMADSDLERRYIQNLEEILFSVSHTIRGPVKTLEGLIYLLINHERLDERTMLDYADKMKVAVAELSLYTSDLARIFASRREAVDDTRQHRPERQSSLGGRD